MTNALNLGAQLANAFDEILERVGSASSASVNAGSISSDTRVYQAKFNSGDWTGQLLSFPVQSVDNPVTPENEIGTLMPAEWDASAQLPAFGARAIITRNPNSGLPVGVPLGQYRRHAPGSAAAARRRAWVSSVSTSCAAMARASD